MYDVRNGPCGPWYSEKILDKTTSPFRLKRREEYTLDELSVYVQIDDP
jgi:hypothetical protein